MLALLGKATKTGKAVNIGRKLLAKGGEKEQRRKMIVEDIPNHHLQLFQEDLLHQQILQFLLLSPNLMRLVRTQQKVMMIF